MNKSKNSSFGLTGGSSTMNSKTAKQEISSEELIMAQEISSVE